MSEIQFSFAVEKSCNDTEARAGVLETAHSRALTPVFMPVATHAAIRGQNIADIAKLGFPILLANTYHLLLRPGVEVFRKFGGIHDFMRWPRSVLTDSGGYQLFSLSEQLRIDEDGAAFKSYVDGKMILLSPESSISVQRAINSDIMMAFDQCIEAPSDRKTTEDALHRTHRWAQRSFAARGDSTQALFGIVQGGCFEDLRKESVEQISAIPFDGIAIGGVAVGEEVSLRNDIIEHTAKLLPVDRPRYLMGVGTPLDLLECVARGMDMFDCIIPTAFAHQGVCFTSQGRVKIGRGVYSGMPGPIDEACRCPTCSTYSRGYLHHLLKAGETLSQTLIGIHNLHFYFSLMSEIRAHIFAGSFGSFYRSKREILGTVDRENPSVPPRRKPRRREELGDYEIVRNAGAAFVKQKSSGEKMHCVTDPSVEAELLYIEQSGFRQRILEADRPLVLWDVGLGAASNAMAAISAYEAATESGSPLAPVRLVSFECDLDPLRLALRFPNAFHHLRHQAPHSLLRTKTWSSSAGPLEWQLLEGDFLERMEEGGAPELVFFDPFSPKVDSKLWTLETFERLFSASAEEAHLFTYSASTAVRAALLAAGFFIAQGAPAGPKEETTIAIRNPAGSRYSLLGPRWLSRFEKSQNRYPAGASADEREAIDRRVRGHPQFSKHSDGTNH